MEAYYHASQYNRCLYDSGITIDKPVISLQTPLVSPPSYSAVMAEKSRKPASEIDIKANETKNIIYNMRRCMIDTHIMLANVHIICLKLESKNDYLMEKMKDVLQSETSYTSISGTISPSQSDDLLGDIDPNDRLSCINHSLEALIEQGKESLSTHLSLHNGTLLRRVDSFPRFTKINRPERKEQRRNSGSDIITDKEERLIQQRKKQNLRYAHSQHNLSVAMKQLMDTVETNTDPIISKSANLSTPTSHSPHVHHHHYTQSTANIINPLPIINNIQSLPSTPIKSFTDSITSSLINYALNTVGVNQFIYPSRKPQKTINAVNRPVFIRMLFYASLLILSTFNSYPVFSPVNPHYISHGTQLIIQWNQRSKEQCALWIQYIHLLAYVTRFL